ncbi:DUF6760 family protein [Treponema lecithinolyticum]|uniref:DUF6760 family protein n=1 Tax=Treponema lecithinolyticum TaxID=53418 RepID=UPI0028F0CB80|nr:DUF6760 family protein [Treponema lecithinolyticum]
MSRMRPPLFGRVYAVGGSISRLSESVYREAADIAYHFHWNRSEIWNMNKREKNMWLAQINRIHREMRKERESETAEQTARVIAAYKEARLPYPDA